MKISNNNKLLKHTSIAGVIIKPNAPDIKPMYKKLKTIFQKHNIEVLLEKDSSKMLNMKNGMKLKKLCKESDF